MLVRNDLHLEWELVKWMALMTLALGLGLALVTQVSGGDRDLPPPADVQLPARPQALPADVTELAKPMPGVPTPDRSLPPPVVTPDYGDVVRLHEALSQHDTGSVEVALETWRMIDLPPDMHQWKLVAMAAAQLQAGELGDALHNLHEVRDLAPENPVVAYYLGVARLAQAEQADDWYDAVGPLRTRYVSHVPGQVSPNSKGMYRLAAQMHFERAIAWKHHLMLDQPLLGVEWVVPDEGEMAMPLVVPTLRELLVALHADDFEGRSHEALGVLHLSRGALQTAEQHLDSADELGRRLGDEYRELGKQFEEREQHVDAARSYLKSLKHGGGVAAPLYKVLENLGREVVKG